MPERNWARDWELWKRVTCMPRYNGGHIEDVHDVIAALRYWLQQVRELEEAVRITSAANEDLATAIQRLKEENARLKAVVEPLVMQDREMLLKKVKDLKQTDGESWAIGEIIERALAALEEEE